MNNIWEMVSVLQGKSSASFKDSSLFGVSLDHRKAEFSSAALRCKVSRKEEIIFFFLFFFLGPFRYIMECFYSH